MKQNPKVLMKAISDRIDKVYDPQNKLNDILKKTKPKLALELVPTTRHNAAHDLFRIYTHNLLRELSKKFEIILIYRDLLATVDIPLEESKKAIQENISLMHNSKVPFKMYYESEILQKHLIDMPEGFFRNLYSNILHKDHNHFNKDLMASSASLAVVMQLLDVLNVDVLLCMHEEKENVDIISKIRRKSDYFPVIFYRSLRDMKNNDHSFEDVERAFPQIGLSEEEMFEKFKKNKTDFETFRDWYGKLGISENKVFENKGNKISFLELYKLVKNKKIKQQDGFNQVVKHLNGFIEKEGRFLELASKEMKLSLEAKNSDKVLSCLNTPSRIGIIKLLDKSNMTAYEIAKQIKVSLPTTLFHLTKMQEAGIVSRNKNKMYSLKTNRFIMYI